MKSLKLNIIFICIALLIIGCKAVDKLSNHDEYKKAPPHGSPLVLPSDLNKDSMENHYPVPKVENGRDVSTVPPGLNSNG